MQRLRARAYKTLVTASVANALALLGDCADLLYVRQNPRHRVLEPLWRRYLKPSIEPPALVRVSVVDEPRLLTELPYERPIARGVAG